jgi:hypothetical protein
VTERKSTRVCRACHIEKPVAEFDREMRRSGPHSYLTRCRDCHPKREYEPLALPGEVWRPIAGYEALYQVSNLGRIQSHYHILPRILNPHPRSGGYLHVTLCLRGHDQYASVHRLVLESFVGPCPPGHEAAHRNGKNQDNRLENLVWATKPENAFHRKLHGTEVSGERHHNARLTRVAVAEIRASSLSGVALARRYGVSPHTISQVRQGRTWREDSRRLEA